MKKQKGSPRVDAGEAGQTLIEILLAFSVSILVLSAVIVGVTTTLSNTQSTKNQNLANSYAQEGMAVVRGIRDSSWPNFVSKTQPTYCLVQNSTILTEPNLLGCGQNVGIFSREVKFEHTSQSCIADPACSGPACLKGSKVTVKVSWSDSKCPVGTPFCHKVELITCFADINSLPPTPTPTPGPTPTPTPP